MVQAQLRYQRSGPFNIQPCMDAVPLSILLAVMLGFQITLHLFQPHQADQMFDPQTGSSYVSKH